ncbi:LIM and calponin homology domains-containing protein 1-like isoform X2 [Xyrauchen texanus]|uniref:LIM and calponin homology domains-containing protein 1-like isoform X2 n=1 Tax=Xyrauchen texanus TaxID=154827 RepID=UPI002242405C|nr:LIM and calponin homology domains-containing protein 1-like isoform X2 [Xyrauchen texanus]
MASPGSDAGRHLSLQPLHHHYHHTEPAPEPAVREAQRWIEAVTGRSFGDKDFRGGLDNGILLCELLSSIKPGLVKKINRLPTAVAALDNVSLFRKGCEELGLKGSQLFDPGDLQDTSTRTNKGPDSNKKIKNVLITIYWLGRAANSSATYNGPTLDLHEFEGLLSQMRKEAEEWDSPKHSIRDSGYIDSWESERSDSFSPPRHARDDSFDSLDSIGSRSRHTPSPDGLLACGYSDGHGSDSESEAPQRKMPDVRKDDMLVRRTSCNEPRTAVPFNQYLPNKSNQSSFMPTPARHPCADREDNRKSWSNATSPVGGERPFSGSDSISSEESHQKCVVTGNGVHYIDLEPVDTDTHPKKSIVLPQNELPSNDPEANYPQLSDPQISSPSFSKNHLHPSVPPHPQEQSHSDCKKMEEEEEMERDGQVTVNQTSQNIRDFLQSDVEMFHNQTAGNYARSVSMFDVRSDEESMLPPHCQVRHELMHNQYNRQKEEEDHWQDDLAKWKSRRRSVSQDLIKKEEERKMVARLLSGDEGSQRRKSIKTYREIVEEKERRERELHEAYLNARTPEEAAAVLQRYAQRFTISEAVLERLKLPKLLERSVSSNPTCLDSLPTSIDISAFSSTSNPLQYLRQQSLPVPKFTSMVEARVTGYNLEQGIMSDTEGISGPVRSHVTASSLDPKQNRQSRSGNNGKRTAKVDEMTQVNGEREDDIRGIEEKGQPQRVIEEEEHSLQCFPSPFQHTEIIQTDVSGVQPMDTLSSTHTPKPDCWEEDREMTEMDKRGTIPLVGDTPMSPKLLELKTDETVAGQGQFSADQACMITEPTEGNQSEAVQDVIQSGSSDTQVNTQAIVSLERSSNQSAASIISSFRTTPVGDTPTSDMAEKDGNDKYQHEQENLKHEWEQVQKEVEEEERRYHKEEGKILEGTVTTLTPLIPHSPSAPSALPNAHSISPQSQWEPAEKQMMSENFRQRENGIGEAAQNKTECLQMTASCGSVGQSYGQRGPDESQEKQPQQQLQHSQDVPQGNRQQQQQNETLKKNISQTKPGGRRRSDSLENIGPNSTTSTSFTDTQPPPSPNRSVSGKKLCSSCGHPLGKGAAMIIETLSLYFHIQCFKCGICKGQLGDTSTGTDVRIRNGLLNCNQCYIRSRSAGQPTTL